MRLFAKRSSEKPVSCFSDDLLSLFFVLFVPVDKFVRFGEAEQGVAAAAVCVDDEYAWRAVEAVFFQHCLMVGRVGGYVDLEEAFHIDGFMHFRLVKCVACHFFAGNTRSEEHTSELQSLYDLVCRLLLEKKKTDT